MVDRLFLLRVNSAGHGKESGQLRPHDQDQDTVEGGQSRDPPKESASPISWTDMKRYSVLVRF